MLNCLRLPELKNIVNLDDVGTTLLHAQILRRKRFLKKLYMDFYYELLSHVGRPGERVVVELGSGGGFIKEILPTVITSDVMAVPSADRVFSAIDMPFGGESVDAFLMINVLHHIGRPREFFREALRCLNKGGKVVMIEPANTPWSRFIYRNFHHENFDPACLQWELDTAGRLSSANDAMAWVIFERDRAMFEKEYPEFNIAPIRIHTSLRYLISGGFTLRQLVPAWSYGLVKAAESCMSPKLTGMFQTIVLTKST